ncbi:MAG: hypothetical protein ABSC06_11380 [Rhodopila sp.]|jgi:hypothetical protein
MTIVDLTLELLLVILAHPECRHDLIMALIYLLAVPTVIFWHHRVWIIYGTASLAYFALAMKAAGLL